ncbi:MAG: GDSL-type esterase/lipase family protein [Candidatus Paceibacterota bacterium]
MPKKYLIFSGFIVLAILGYFLFKPRYKIVNYPPVNNTVVAFGDSLVQGVGSSSGHDFVSLLSTKIGRPITNLGVSGETTTQGLARVRDVTSQNPGIVLVLFGGNDYLQKVSPEVTFQNLRAIISALQAKGAMVVLLGIRGGLLSDHFEASFRNLARSTGSVYVPDVLSGLLADSRYMSDQVHPNNLGYSIIADKVYQAMKGYLK